jgi:hypothetical protein
MIQKGKLLIWAEYTIALIMVYCNGSWLFLEHKTLMISLLIGSLFFYLVYKIYLKKDTVAPNFLVFFLILFPIISLVVNWGEKINFLSVLYTGILYFILGCLSKNVLLSFLDKYANIIYKLAIISIVLGPLLLLFPFLLNYIPIKYTSFVPDEYGYYNLIAFTFRVSGGARSQSIFWEPGAWAFNEAFALYWFLYIKNDYKKLPVLVVSILLTTSTTGLALLFILLLLLITRLKDKANKKKILYTSLATIIVLGVSAIYLNERYNLNLGEILYDQIIGKFSGTSYTSISYEERANSTKTAIEILNNNPFFGIGKMTESFAIYVTSSFSEISYQFGYIFLIVYAFLYRVLFNKLGFFASVIFIFIMLNGEAYAFMILASLIVIYGSKGINTNSDLRQQFFIRSFTKKSLVS